MVLFPWLRASPPPVGLRAEKEVIWGDTTGPGAALTAKTPRFVIKKGGVDLSDSRGRLERMGDPPAPKEQNTHIVWNGEFVRGGLSRGVQTCGEGEETGMGGHRGAGDKVGGTHSTDSPPSIRCWLQGSLQDALKAGGGAQSERGGYATPPRSPSLFPPPKMTPIVSPSPGGVTGPCEAAHVSDGARKAR